MPDLTAYDYDIFLSHNRADQEWTATLAERLEKEDWPTDHRKLKVFFSPWDIRPGQSIPKEIEKALPRSRKVGLILSPDAVDSAWVELERLVTTYINISARDERLIPLYRRDCEVPALLRAILYLDFREDAAFEESYQTLLLVIKGEPLPRGVRGSSPSVTSISASPPHGGATMEDDTFDTLRFRLKRLRQLKDEELIDEGLKQRYEDRAMDEWFRQTIRISSNEPTE